MSQTEFSVVTETPMLLGESPLWHPREAVLYWIDIDGCAVHRLDPASGARQQWAMPSEPGCIAWCEAGGLLVATRKALLRLHTDSGALTELAPAPYDTSKSRFNDGRCDQAGRLWVGTIYEPRDHQGGTLFCVEQGEFLDTGNAVTVSNGVAFSPDQGTLYHADTTAHRISSYQLDQITGQLGPVKIFKEFSMDRQASDYGGRPDGAAVDSEGAYWCAMFEGARLLRFSATGELLREITLPVRCPTMLTFGGPELRTLYITSARHNRSDAELAQYPLSGHVLSLPVDIAGLPEPGYRL